MAFSVEEAVRLLDRPVLQANPFPGAITGRSDVTLERLNGFSEEQRSKIEGDLKRLQSRRDEPGDWELAALRHALRQWRIFEAFRRLHEMHWCPALFFRLSTKTDFLTLCDPEADSSAGGFSERARKVLVKRGIDHRFKWREARRMIQEMGLLDLPGHAGDGHTATPPEVVPEPRMLAPEGAPAPSAPEAMATFDLSPVEESVLAAVHAFVGTFVGVIRFALEELDPEQQTVTVSLVERGFLRSASEPGYVLLTDEGLELAEALRNAGPVSAPEASPSSHPSQPAQDAAPAPEQVSPEPPSDSAASSDDGLPQLRLDRVWSALPGYTKAQLEAVYTRMACGLWTQFADRFYPSFKKAEMLVYVQRLVRFHANLEAVQHLAPVQLDGLFDWMRSRLGDRFQRDVDMRIAARLYSDFLVMAELGLLSPEAWSRYRDAEVRRIGAFCYHLFYEHQM